MAAQKSSLVGIGVFSPEGGHLCAHLTKKLVIVSASEYPPTCLDEKALSPHRHRENWDHIAAIFSSGKQGETGCAWVLGAGLPFEAESFPARSLLL